MNDSRARRSRRAVLVLAVSLTTVAAGMIAVLSPSADAVQSYVLPATGTVAVQGHGNGHGHGMSQYGARGAAIAGLSAAQIISFYYPGTKLVTMGASTVRVLLSNTGASTVVLPSAGLTLSTVGALDPTAAAYRLVATGSTLRLDKRLQGSSTWTSVRSNLPNGTYFVHPGGAVRVLRTDNTSTAYWGEVHATISGSSVLTINKVPLDQYTQGVVPREMPASWQSAAVQAQAIAARTYGRQAVETHASSPYDICDTTQCQVYGGATHYDASGHVLWTDDPAALSGNANVVAQYNGVTIFAQFSASDGGWTVAGGQPYLVAKQDPYDNTASGDPYLNWMRTVSVSGVASYYGLTKVNYVTVTQRDGHGDWGGRVLAGIVNGTASNGTIQNISTTGFELQDAMSLPHNWFNILAPNKPPIGHLDRAQILSHGMFGFFGWTFDPNHPDRSGQVALKVNGVVGSTQLTTTSRPDVQNVFGLQTSIVGYGLSAKVAPGSYTICVEGVDQDGGGIVDLACRTMVMPDQIGSTDIISGGTGSYRVAGWALDPDHKNLPGEYQVVVDGTAGPVQTTTVARPDVQSTFRTSIVQLGYDQTRSVAAGTHTVCVNSIDREGGPAVPLGCKTVTVS